ncbi:dihydrofolate reductase family protein [Arthrobacter sp. zg-Y179]|uniref:dihydrofolate reductase family protein n=1 Tax=Arthrobacter sp. zg-Y179 TaxID=2894188 RepID=UPI001E3F3092|nr:dihydrofolate reductase family protein [Arthrobacter sp. zg-Y179]MCC9174740.1 dihydrofolate reductase family protein [Arthrobacter sp. zg-Y179]
MVRTVYYASISLDGFTADTVPGGESIKADNDRFRVAESPANAGAVVMGAGTYARLQRQVGESGAAVWDCPPGPVWVYTHHEFPAVPGADIMFVRGPVGEFAADIADSANGSDVWLRGADLAGQYLHHGLLDELRLVVHPVLLGQGRPLLPLAAERPALLLSARRSADGSMRLCYGLGAAGEP